MLTGGVAGLGIDFGTSTTVAMLAGDDGVPRPLLFDASPLLSSAVFAVPGGDLLTGADAERAAVAYPAAYEPNPKRRVDEHTVLLGEREVTVVDLVAAVLRRVAAEAERSTGTPPPTVVLTHPATWGPPRLAVLAESAERAGLGAVRFVPEPVAAAAYLTGGALTGAGVLVEFWDPATATLTGTTRDLGHPARITSMAYDRRGALLATGDATGRVVLLDAPGRRPISTTGPTGAPIQSLAFSPDGRWLATGDSRGMIRLHPVRR
ncbi:hypothetical protein [Dactylosporangium sp. NPDC005555]|uniref:hypothetical protein n=1 Tax=Dactylosporangium sp. NPDC005555 TaxID=3154889 RepID=UPI0033AD0046